jgi:hypothetical protein
VNCTAVPRTVAVLMLCAIGMGSRVQSQSPAQNHSDWRAVRFLPMGTHVKVAQRSGPSLEGRLKDWTEDDITVRARTGDVKVPRVDVVRLVRISGTNRSRRAAWVSSQAR